jgi:hypothetical protein
MNPELGTLIVDTSTSEPDVQAILTEIGQLMKRRGYLLQLGFSRRTRQHRIILARVTGNDQALAVAEIESVNPLYVTYRMLGETALAKRMEVA